MLYVERRGSDYTARVAGGDGSAILAGQSMTDPDVWIYLTARWPLGDRAACSAMFDDLLAEMESMAGGLDRCRWPLDEPWPHGH